MDLELISGLVGKFGRIRSGDLFHSVVRDMLSFLDFSLVRHYYKALEEGSSNQATGLDDLRYHGNPSGFVRREEFVRDILFKENVSSVTYYKNLDDLRRGFYYEYVMVSDSPLGSKNTIIDLPTLIDNRNTPIFTSKDFVVKGSNGYYFHPELLYTLCVEKMEK